MTTLASTSWSVTPLPIILAVVGLALFARGFGRLRVRAPRHARWWRAALFCAAVLLALLATVSPLHEAGEQDLLSAHMLEHVVIGDLVPAAMMVSLRGPLLAFVVPAVVIAGVTRRARLQAMLGRLVTPAGAVAVWLASLAAWHVPRVYDAAAASFPLHLLQHASFLLSGLLVWFVLVDVTRRHTTPTAAKLAVALTLFTAGQFLATTLVLAEHPIYPRYASGSGLLGLSPLADQDAAGLVMMGEQLLTLGLFAIFAVRRHLEESLAHPSADPLIRQALGRQSP
jgi:cytochrome c oxidase assembly factor CtaG